MTYTLALAGSTERAVQIASLIAQDPRCAVVWTVSPATKNVGRKQVPTDNPLHNWSIQQSLPSIRVEHKIDQIVKNDIENAIYRSADQRLEALRKPDFLLVVDFGYLIPSWLLELPTIAPLNLHPSVLPAWRGSAPAVGPLLSGDNSSAMSLIVMNSKLDQGPIVQQVAFEIEPSWSQSEYYRQAFSATSGWLINTIVQFAQGQIKAKAQPALSPTPLARQLTKDDSFLPWSLVQALCDVNQYTMANSDQLPPFLLEVWQYLKTQEVNLQTASTIQLLTLPEYISRAALALSPWPQLWTSIPTSKGEKRMKLLATTVDINGNLQLDKVHVEGQRPSEWNQVKNIISQ